MKRVFLLAIWTLLTLTWLALPGLRAQEWVELPRENNLLADAPRMPWVRGGDNASQVSFSWSDDTMRLKVAGPRVLKEWSIRVETPIDAAVKKGELLYLRFRIRCLDTRDESGGGRINPAVQLTAPPHTKEISAPLTVVGSEWRVFATRAVVTRDYPAGSLDINLRVGLTPQELEISDLELYAFPGSWDIERLPVTPSPTYEGREAGAAWREAADERIDRLRRQELRIVATDARGEPVSRAAVHVEQIRHAYRFGTAVQLWALEGKTADDIRYREVLEASFDACGTENDLKWRNWLSDRANTLKWLPKLREAGFPVRGHTLFWPSWHKSPDFLRSYEGDPEKLREVILEHVRDELGAVAPFTEEFDVINEPLLNQEILDACGDREFMTDVYREARKTAPDVRLFLNEAVTLSDNRLMRGFLGIVDELVGRDTPFDGLGIQCHYTEWTLTPPEEILSTLDMLETRGKAIAVTEFDVDTLDERLQADYLRDFYTAVFSHPGTTGIQMWGFWAGRHWKPIAAPWRRDWSLRPSAQAYLDLVRGKWWTNDQGMTDAEGVRTLRAFKGRLRVTVRVGDQEAVREIDLGDEPETLRVTVGESRVNP